MRNDRLEIALSQDRLKEILELSALKVGTEEMMLIRDELNEQMRVISELLDIELEEDLEPYTHGIDFTGLPNKLRPDQIIPSQTADEILALSSGHRGRFLSVSDYDRKSDSE